MIDIETVDDAYPYVSTDREALLIARFLLADADADDPDECVIQPKMSADDTDAPARRYTGIERLTANERSITGTNGVYRAVVRHPLMAGEHEREVTVYPHGGSYTVDPTDFRRFTTPDAERLHSSVYQHKQTELWAYGMTTVSPRQYRRNPTYRP